MKAVSTAFLTILLCACGDVSIKPEAILPKPLIVKIPADVGLIIPPDTRKYVDRQTRFGVDWKVDLGPGEVRLMQEVFKDLFQHVEEFKDLEAARASKDLKALFETRVDQYSFVTARETKGRYYAVTIRYRINLYTPQGEKVDSYTLTGYGNSLAVGMSGGKPLAQATVGAMRDAAAKFLVQFPEQPSGQQLARNEPVVADKPSTSAEAAQIEAVPIDEPVDDLQDTPVPQPAPAAAQPTPAVEPAAPPKSERHSG
ncbi:MAG: hypothetical protein ACJ8R9_07905 [Steroidobacteraceae bacterium]